MKYSLLKYIYAFVIFISFTAISFAQDDIDPHPADDDPDPAGAPFNMRLLIVIMLLGIGYAYYAINKRKKQLENN